MKLRMKNKRPYSHNGFRDFFGEFESLLLRQKVKPSSFNNCWVFLTLPRLSGVRLSCLAFSFLAKILCFLQKNYG
nr:MAG TPA: hypothetical protein [Caudoviricetes sp.]